MHVVYPVNATIPFFRPSICFFVLVHTDRATDTKRNNLLSINHSGTFYLAWFTLWPRKAHVYLHALRLIGSFFIMSATLATLVILDGVGLQWKCGRVGSVQLYVKYASISIATEFLMSHVSFNMLKAQFKIANVKKRIGNISQISQKRF